MPDPTQPPKKALSAWDRRRLYSNQLREKAQRRTPGVGPSYSKESETPSRVSPNKKKSRPRESKHPMSQRKPLKSVHSLTARNGDQFTVALTKTLNTSVKKPKASLQSGKAEMTVKPGSKRASGTGAMPLPSASKKVNLCALASEPTTAAVPKMPQVDKSTRMPAKSQQQPQKAKQPLRVPLAQATVQLSQRPLGRKSTAPTQTKVHTAKRSLGRRSQVVKAQTSRQSFGRRSTSKLSAKTRAHTQSLLASGTSCSVGEQPRKKASEGSGKTPNKTPLKMTKVLSPCVNANVEQMQMQMCVASVEQRSSPRSCQAKVERRNSLLASCSTPCSAMVRKSAPNSRDTVPDDTKRTLSPDRSSGSTPYHTAHSICLSSSSGGSVSPIGKVGRKFAGGTPFHVKQHSSFVSVTESPTGTACTDKISLEDVSVQDELNDTFTLESPALSPKRRSSCSKKPPSSCLRKGTTTSHVKKSVSFTMPGRRSVTPKRLPKTPIRSRTLQESLKEWLNARGYSLSALRQTHEDNGLHQEKLEKSRRSSGKPIRTALMSAENKALGTSPVLQKSARHSLQQMSGNDEAASSKHASLPSLLTDLLQYLNKSNPPEDVETWLNQLEEQVPSVMDYPDYWMCRCVCYEKSGDSAKAVKSLTMGLDLVTTGRNELADALNGLAKNAPGKAPEVTHNPPTRKRERKQSAGARKKQNLEQVSTENMFASTIIDYKVYEKPCLNQLSAALHGKQCPSVAVMTPVRRSSRHSKRHSSLVSPPQTLLYKPNFALGDER
ncbi:mucin-4-like isoform X2 [Dermacentor albipictus]|uniref:mucin-4-like isoform X2 n=1 Tax=Dermacentor albipictus TaxID=60249 RepID=UPI0031FBB942